jgi:hypothetical protein
MPRLVLAIPLIFLAFSACSPLPTPDAPGRGTYESAAGFSIQYPTSWQRLDTGEYPIVFSTQAAPGTTLLEKRMEIDVRDLGLDCRQTTYGGAVVSDTLTSLQTDGGSFLVESGTGIAAGNIYDWTSYSTLRGFNCVTITFVLHSADPGVYATNPPPFDKAAESAIFDELLGTYRPRAY